MSKSSATGLVYSTDAGRICPACRKPVLACSCVADAAAKVKAAAARNSDGIARVGLETKGRGGKTVSVVRGLLVSDEALAALGKRLRSACGCGGTSKDGVIELQGDHCDQLLRLLAVEGFAARRMR